MGDNVKDMYHLPICSLGETAPIYQSDLNLYDSAIATFRFSQIKETKKWIENQSFRNFKI